MLIMNKGQRETMEGIELPNQEIIKKISERMKAAYYFVLLKP